MISPSQSDIGRTVVYRPHSGAEPEQGVITDVRGAYVFVRYGADQHSKATAGRDLEWVSPKTGGRA